MAHRHFNKWLERDTECYDGCPNERARVERCTVHASPGCLDPDGPTYSGSGWDHGGLDQRIECSACAKVLSS